MEFAELQTKTPDELKKILLDLKKEQMDKRFQLAGGQLEKTSDMRGLRRQIARVMTAMGGKAAAPAPTTETKKAAPKKTAAKKKAPAAKKEKAA